jgi:hypothetical protein
MNDPMDSTAARPLGGPPLVGAFRLPTALGSAAVAYAIRSSSHERQRLPTGFPHLSGTME